MPASLSDLDELIIKENLICGKEAIELSGMQDFLIEIVSIKNLFFDSITSFILNKCRYFPPFNSPGSPKPSNIHSKTSELVGGYIPIDPIFTRLDNYRKPLGHHYHDNIDLQESVQVKWTLWEILKRCNKDGDLYIDWPVDVSPIIRFKFKENKGPLGFNGFFQLDLGEEKTEFDINDLRVITRSVDDPEKYLHLIPSKITEAFFRNPKEIIYMPYKIFYNKDNNDLMQPLKVLAKDGKPIISDWDKDLESLPLNAGIIDLQSVNQEFNTLFDLNSDDNHIVAQLELIKATKKLFLNLLYKNFTFQDQFNNLFLLGLNKYSKSLMKDIDGLFHRIAIKTSLLERAGIITPYEFLSNILTNHLHNCNNAKQGLSRYFDDPFQHGLASRSPFFLDKTISNNSDGPRFNIVVSEDNYSHYAVNYIYTVTEEQRIKLLLIKGILESNFIHINSCVDMAKWSIIIDKQIELGQEKLICMKTMDKYLLFKGMQHALRLPCKIVGADDNKKGDINSKEHDIDDGGGSIKMNNSIGIARVNISEHVLSKVGSVVNKYPVCGAMLSGKAKDTNKIRRASKTDEEVLFNFYRRNSFAYSSSPTTNAASILNKSCYDISNHDSYSESFNDTYLFPLQDNLRNIANKNEMEDKILYRGFLPNEDSKIGTFGIPKSNSNAGNLSRILHNIN